MGNTYNTLDELFLAIADAIRTKKQTTETIIADDFPEEISSIETSSKEDLSSLRALLASINIETTDEDDLDALVEKFDLYVNPYELVSGVVGETGEDRLGTFTWGNKDYTPNPNINSGYFRLRPGVETMPNLQVFYGESYDLTEMTQETRRRKPNGTYATISVANGAARLIFPETVPNAINQDGSINPASIPGFLSIPPVACLLPKYSANYANNSNWITGSPSSSTTEHIVIAPEGMCWPAHLHRFTLMTEDTIVAILNNLADVNGMTVVNSYGRTVNFTLTLGATNLDKLTEEQKNIAYAKGWTLA